MDSKDNRSEVDRNYEEFQKLLPSIISVHPDKYALMSDGVVVGYYSTLEDAYTTANTFLKDKPFSVQQVTSSPIDLGFFSHAVHIG